MKTFLTISEVAKKYPISAHTLRYYDKVGLLPPMVRSRGGARLFSQADLEWLELILGLKQTGMSLKEIQAFVATMHHPDGVAIRLAVLQQQYQKVKAEIASLKAIANLLMQKCHIYETALEQGNIPEDSACRAFYQNHQTG